jgi:subtilisin family serine protease
MKQSVYLATVLFFLTAAGQQAMGQEQRFDYVPGEVLVRYKSHVSTSSSRALDLEQTAETRRVFGRIGVHHLKLPAGLSVEQAIEVLRADSSFEYVEPNYIRYAAQTIPDDTHFDELWGLHNDGTSGTEDADIDAPEAWDIATDCGSIVVAVIDSGVDYGHPDLNDNIWSNPGEIPGDGIDNDLNGYVDDVQGWDYVGDDNDPGDMNSHGTHVAGTIGAEGNNATGTTGVCWTAKIMPLRFLDDSGAGTVADEISAIDYAIANGASIINASFSSDAFSIFEEDAISDAMDAGILFVAAASNDGDATPEYPAGLDLDNIISVAATDQDDELAWFSNYGASWVDVGAPGVNIYSTLPGGIYGFKNGTSMATPHVVGLAGLIWNTDQSLTHAEVKGVILITVDPLASLLGKTVTGGRINAFNALDALSSPLPLPPSQLSATPISTSQIDLAWAQHSSQELGFKIERKLSGGSFSQIDTVPVDTTTYSDQSASEGTSYTYRVRAYNGDGDSDYSNEADAITFPASPTGLSATAVSSSRVNLSWEDNSFGESGFKVERKTGSGGTYAQIATVDADVISHINTGLMASTTYYYRVRAHNSGGDSIYSNEANATTSTPPPRSPQESRDVAAGGGGGGGSCFIVTAASPR